ncbi:hypothetical protein L618_002900000140 [Rhodococcus rhodochrous J45]|uniref:FMN-binding domain-containing protein n=1 Tax=Rhodococcus rhodochrous J45 TaxID=935266 RepID=A0A562E310_RHORH|nr:hypothetical protein [Rhodococcus rhodochrous]TWH16078.1 hypothetical protein L618_002900000140 [Rhodococcus rhodochrous J45]
MKHHILTRAAAGTAVSLAVIAPLAGCSSDDGSTQSSSTESSSTESSPSRASTNDTTYGDGTYTVRGVYGGAPSYMTITLALNGGTITDVVVEPMPENNDTSRGYQERFAAAAPDEVIGESIDDLEVDIIAGASGCADGFNDALAKIREEAATNN